MRPELALEGLRQALVPLQAEMALLAFGSLRNPMLGWLAVGQAVLGVVLASAWFRGVTAWVRPELRPSQPPGSGRTRGARAGHWRRPLTRPWAGRPLPTSSRDG